MINLYQGETASIVITVVDTTGTPVPLSGATAIFSYRQALDPEATVVTLSCYINDSTVSTEIDALTTSEMLGDYVYETKVRDYTGDIDMVLTGIMRVTESIIPTGLIQ